MKETLMSSVQSQLGNLDNVDAKELGEAVDMIKDLSEAIYYCTITKEMEECKEEKKIMDKMENKEVDTSDVKRLTDSEKKIANSWITKSAFKFFNSLDGVKTEWIESFKNSKTIAGREAMSRNGRAWTEGFKVKFTKDGKEKEFVFDIITNEGGGLYGYAVDAQKMNLSDFKTYVNAVINKL